MALSNAMSALLECKICLDQFENPKLLSCGHTYCKNCLDKILIFKEDGSAEIQCPFKCKISMIIGADETTSCLTKNYSLSDIVDEAERGKTRLSNHQCTLCQQSTQCKKKVTLSCTKCGMKICDQCQILHLCSTRSFTAITFDKKSEEIKPLCKQHNSFANNVCIECENTFTCIYCTNRQHKNHKRITIAEFGVEAKNWFHSFIESFEDTKRELEILNNKYNEALTGLQNNREKIVRELEIRRLRRVEQYIERLNAEDKKLLGQYDKKVTEFKNNVIAAGYIDNKKIKDRLEYVKVFNDKSFFELVVEKVEIERNLRDLSTLPAHVHCFSSHLHDLNEHHLVVNPLGEMTIFINNVHHVSVDDGYINVYDCRINEIKSHCNQLELERNLMGLVERLKENAKPAVDVIGALGEGKSGVKPKSKPTDKKAYTFQELFEIIANGGHKKFQSVLISNTNVAKMRGDNKYTLLMEAAYYNEPSIVKVLLNVGSDVNAVDEDNSNAYHISALNGHHDVLKVLINHDVTNINDVDRYSDTPLHEASQHGRIKCVKLLLSVPHIGVNIQNKQNKTAYDVADNNTIKRLFEEHQRN